MDPDQTAQGRGPVRPERPMPGLGPVLGGVFIAALIVLTLLIAIVLGVQEQSLVAGVSPTASPVPTTASVTPSPPPPTGQPTTRPVPSPTPTPSPCPTPTSLPLPTVTPSCQPPASWREYRVQRGETLAILAWRFWTTEEALREANCLEEERLEPGQLLYVPDVATRTACGRPPGWFAYTVRRGDTLSSLAVWCSTSVARLKQANCLFGDTLYAGARLWLPCLIPMPPTPSRTPLPGETPTPTVTGTLQPPPTETETPTGTPSPTETGAPTDTPPPTETGAPTNTPPPTETGAPTDTPPPTDTPVPPTDTPLPPPTDTPVPPAAA